jgi:hypothetical protein
MRRRIARLRDSGNLAWSIAATIISLIAIAPVLAILVLALQSSGDTWPHQAGAAQIACIMLAFVFAMISGPTCAITPPAAPGIFPRTGCRDRRESLPRLLARCPSCSACAACFSPRS